MVSDAAEGVDIRVGRGEGRSANSSSIISAAAASSIGRAQIQPTVKSSGVILGSFSDVFASRCRLAGGIICESGIMESAVELVVSSVVGTSNAVGGAIGLGFEVRSGRYSKLWDASATELASRGKGIALDRLSRATRLLTLLFP